MEMKKKKTLFGILAFVGILSITIGVSVAFFNYTRTGAQNTVKTGRISFNATQGNTINLTNAFPISSTEAETDTTNAKTMSITVVGDTDYSGGVEYLLTLTDVNNTTTTGKTVPITLEVSVTGNGLGTEEAGDYYTNRNNYSESKYKIEYQKLQNDSHILVGYIAPNTTLGTASGINGTINIKVYFNSDDILISDTWNDGNEPTDELGTSLSIGEGKTVLTTSEWNSLTGNNALSFKVKVESNEGIWVPEPLTAVGQIIKEVNTTTQINFGNISSASNGQGLYILPGTENDTNPIYYYRGAVTDNNVIFGGFCWQMVRTTDTGGIKMIYNGVATGDGKTCENTAHADRIISSSAFNSNYQSVSDVGYMYNTRYAYTNSAAASNSIFGKNVEWNGTNYLVIEDTAGIASTNTTKNANHHYSCGTANTSSCASVRYYYYNNYYITLTGGELVEDALYKMTGNGSDETKTKNASYVLNATDSKAKTEIENWFKTNLTNEVDTSKTNYQEYLEDTVFCNDRSYEETVYNQSGWNPNGGSLSTYLYFGTWNRFNNSNWYSTEHVPSMECENVTDQFSVSNQKAKLKYPVGLLTADEIILAGAAGNSYTSNTSYYLYTGNYYWSLSPGSFDNGYAYEFYVSGNGFLNVYHVHNSDGLRPVVSLKLGTEFEDGGDGTTLKPYVVKIVE